MDYIFIDESGDLGKKSNYFVIGAIIVKDSKQLNRIINKTRKKYKKQLEEANEIKGSKTPPHIIKKTLNRLNSIDYKTVIIVFDKQYKYKIDFKSNNNYLYNILASELACEININSSTVIYIDKSKNKESDINIFNKIFLDKLNNFKGFHVKINHVNSVNYKGLQVIDLIVWSVFQSVEKNNNEFVALIENKNIKRIYED